jgi:hypothetical protein
VPLVVCKNNDTCHQGLRYDKGISWENFINTIYDAHWQRLRIDSLPVAVDDGSWYCPGCVEGKGGFLVDVGRKWLLESELMYPGAYFQWISFL